MLGFVSKAKAAGFFLLVPQHLIQNLWRAFSFNEAKSIMSNISKGLLLSLLAAALFTPIYAAGKISAGQFPALLLITLRYVGGFAVVVLIVLGKRIPISELRSTNPLHHFARALLGSAGGLSAIYAGSVIPIAYATAIGLTRGIFVILLAGLILKELVERRHWIACLISIFGALVVVAQPFREDAHLVSSYTGVLAAFAGALFVAMEVIFVKVISNRENAITILLYTNAFAASLLSIISFLALDISMFLSPDILPFFLLGPVAILAQFCNIKAYRFVEASTLAPVSYSSILFSTLLGILAFGEVPTISAVFGLGLICLGGVVIAQMNNDRD